MSYRLSCLCDFKAGDFHLCNLDNGLGDALNYPRILPAAANMSGYAVEITPDRAD